MLGSFLLFSAAAANANDLNVLPSADEVVAKMMQHDSERQAALDGYTALRRYTLENRDHHKRAEMLVRLTCMKDGSKQFEMVSSDGWAGARKHVFQRLLDAEAEASHANVRDQSRVTPDNYSFAMIGEDDVNGRAAYVVEVTPKVPKKYLMRGKIWIDASDYAIVRMQGMPAKNPSFWIKSVTFEHKYEKHGPFYFPASDESLTDVRIFGRTDLTIEYFDYTPNTTASVLRDSLQTK